jgi:hypothetical protein
VPLFQEQEDFLRWESIQKSQTDCAGILGWLVLDKAPFEVFLELNFSTFSEGINSSSRSFADLLITESNPALLSHYVQQTVGCGFGKVNARAKVDINQIVYLVPIHLLLAQ